MSVRITHRAISDSTLRGLQDALQRTQNLQEQLSSGRRIGRPSDDPSAAGASMQLRSQRRADEQYLRNIDDAMGRLNVTDSALTQLSDRIRRANELVVRSGSASSSSSREATAAELRTIKEEITDLLNTRWLGRPIFGGTALPDVAIDAGGAYVGNDQPVVTRISRDATMRVDVAGTAVGADSLPGILEQAIDDVVNNPAALGTNLTALDGALKKVLTSLGDIGARGARLETAKNNLESEKLDFTTRISTNENIDLPETIMKLEMQQVAYQAALGAASKVLQVSLVDFLR